jgi:hypothetical protein
MRSMMFRVKSSGPPMEDVVMSRASFRVELPIEAWDVMRDAIAGSQNFDLDLRLFAVSELIQEGANAPWILNYPLLDKVSNAMLSVSCSYFRVEEIYARARHLSCAKPYR